MARLPPSPAEMPRFLEHVRQLSHIVGDCVNEVNSSDVQIWRETLLAKATAKVNELASCEAQIGEWLSEWDINFDTDIKFQLRLHRELARAEIKNYSNCVRSLNMSLLNEEVEELTSTVLVVIFNINDNKGWSGWSEGQSNQLNQDVLNVIEEMDDQDWLAAFDDDCLVNMAAGIMVLILPFLWLISLIW